MDNSRGIVLYLHVHQPWRVRNYDIFDVASKHNYFSESPSPDQDNELIFHKVADKSYKPMNHLLEKLLNDHPDFKVSLSITGTFIEQAEQFDPGILDSFRRLVDTGRVEILSETYHHSLAFFYDRNEFEAQVERHRQKIREVFGVETRVFRNTELAYNNELAKWADDYGFNGIIAEGWDDVLGWRSPNYVYRPVNTGNIKLLMKNYRLSDDIAFRFSDRGWADWPLTADKYHRWASTALEDAPLLNLFMDYETFGEHQWAEDGIFEFFEQFVRHWVSRPDQKFYTISEAIEANEPQGEISVTQTVTWADSERDLSAWLGNNLQHEAMKYIYDMTERVLRTGDGQLIDDWRKLQTADHVYYMSTKHADDGSVHSYFSPYSSPYEAFLNYMNAIRDIRWRTDNLLGSGVYDG